MTIFAVLILTSLVTCCEASNLAIARTFSSNDAKQLPGSFDVWDTHPPCVGTSEPSVDLFLAFSQSLENSPVNETAVAEVTKRFQETNGWGGCIAKLFAFGTDIAPEYDLYKSKEQAVNALWVNGPNRQFERTVRKIQNHPSNSYELMYLMEMDSVPVKDYWLDILLEEIELQSLDFAILGSKYRGDKWDSFFSEMPTSLLNHINGNAIYNLTHPMLQRIVGRLEVEAPTAANSIPYDYRVSQIVEEIQTGIMPSIPIYLGTMPALKLPQSFVDLGKMFDLDIAVRETRVIANYASTNIVPDYLDEGDAIIHGAALRSSWETENVGDITLIVSDWHEAHSRVLLSGLDRTRHPFRNIIVMMPQEMTPPQPLHASMQIDYIRRGNSPDFLDMCTAPVNTTWFMMTDSYHQLRKSIQLMTQADEDNVHKPVVSFSRADAENCFGFASCSNEWEFAKQILPSVRDVYQSQDFVFHTDTRNEYCQAWRADFNATTTPSATSYVAFLQMTGRADALYVHSDRSKTGSRPAFLPLPTTVLPPVMRSHRRLMDDNSTNATVTDCAFHETSAKCSASGCEWRPQFGSCRDFAPDISNAKKNLPPRKTRPIWATVFLALGVACAGVLLVALLMIGIRRSSSDDDANSSLAVAPLSDNGFYPPEQDSSTGSRDASNAADDEENSSSSFETISLVDSFSPMPRGNFEENDEGIEFVRE